jgi:single-strand DNA-binding protein
MSIGYSRVFLIGNVGKEPVASSGPDGRLRVRFQVAVDRTRAGDNGERRTEADWFPVVAWGRAAEICQQFLSKGSQVFLSGRLQTRRWQDQDGDWHGITEVNLRTVLLLDRPESDTAECGES